ncbi:MAG: hypothetical protein IMZ43_10080 [Thermoplasmata archaeon]|nr:hypothetical protein [Thermoplasmata archaeon]
MFYSYLVLFIRPYGLHQSKETTNTSIRFTVGANTTVTLSNLKRKII